MARAVCEIPAVRRWAVTGTPIQNRLTDLAALLKFLHAHPYDDLKRFDADITRLWKEQQVEEAVKRLQTLSGCLLLRRPKQTVNLPPRRDMRCPVAFSPGERALYDEIKYRTISSFDAGVSNNGAFVIQQINSLRLACNLGLHYHSRHERIGVNTEMQEAIGWDGQAQQVFNFQYETASISCQGCSASLNITEAALEESTNDAQPRYAQCLRFICSECIQAHSSKSRATTCGHMPPHPIAPVSTSRAILEEAALPMSLDLEDLGVPKELPTKIQKLVAQIQTQPVDAKW